MTRYHLSVYPAPKTILSNTYIHPLESLENVTATLDKLVKIKDKRVEILMLLMHNPDAPPEAPQEQSKLCIIGAYAFADNVNEAKSMLAPFAKSSLAVKSMATMEYQPTSFEKLFAPEQLFNTVGRFAVDNILTDDPGKALNAVSDHFRSTPSPINHVLTLYGINLEQRNDTCFSSNARNYINCTLIWDEKKDDDLNFQWLGNAQQLMDPFAKGHYVNEVDARLNPDRIRRSFSEPNWNRLLQLRQKFDPEGVFHTYLGHA